MNSCETCIKDDNQNNNDELTRPPRERRQPPPPPPTNESPSKFNRPPPPLPNDVQQPEQKPQTIISKNELELGAELGQGEFGSVLRGVWRNTSGKAVSKIGHYNRID